MKNIIKKFIALVLIFVFGHFFINSVWADEEQENPPVSTPIHLTIISGENSLYDSEISVTACDSDNNPETEDLITAYCSVIQSGLESDWNWSWAPGAFVNSIEDIAGYTSQDSLGNDVYHYWSWSLNGEMGSTGLNQYELVASDTILLEFIDPEEEEIQENPPISTPIHLTIISGENSLYDSEISVTACDSDNNPETEDLITAYCAVIQSGLESDWNWSWAPGAFVNSIEDIAGYTSQDSLGNDVYHYWSWSLNGEMGSTGLNQYELVASDTILLDFIDPEEETNNGGGNNGGGSGGGNEIPISFSIDDAIDFLSLNKGDNNFFGGTLYSDWAVIGISNSGTSSDSLKNELYSFYKDYNYNSSLITDNERHAMALMSLGINPYNETEVNYIEKITDSFDGEQIGDDSLINDDVFGLIVLKHAGFSKSDEIIKKTVSFIISEQQEDGSWGSSDMTSAAIQALYNFKSISGANSAIEKGELYLLGEQNDDGGFGNSFSTSWAVQALVLDDSYETEAERAILYLANQQKEDGGLDDGSIESRIWATAYAIPAVLKMSWSDILESFDKEEIITPLEDEEIIGKEDTPVELIEAPVQVEMPIEKITIDNQDIKNLKNNLVVEKKEEKNVIDEKKEVNNVLLASAGGIFIEKDESPNLFFQKLNNFFQRLFSYFRAFRLRLLSVK